MSDILGFGYRAIVKPILFNFDAELVHDSFTKSGEFLGKYKLTRSLVDKFFNYKTEGLAKKINGIDFPNPVGLAAGFDYDGRLATIIKNVGFGFSTVGTVTAKSYEGNKPPRLVRLPKSKSILVNKGFKSEGVYKVAKRLENPLLRESVIGASIGSSNTSEINTVSKAIDDYVESFSVLEKVANVKYYELNISCPNTALTESFTDVKNYSDLLTALATLRLSKPIFVKMPNEIDFESCDALIKASLSKDIHSFVFSNLAKDRSNPAIEPEELTQVKSAEGNFSGIPTRAGALRLVKHFRQQYQKDIVIVGCGGIFSPEDAIEMLQGGADLIQLITGMIFEGPTLIGQINKTLESKL